MLHQRLRRWPNIKPALAFCRQYCSDSGDKWLFYNKEFELGQTPPSRKNALVMPGKKNISTAVKTTSK